MSQPPGPGLPPEPMPPGYGGYGGYGGELQHYHAQGYPQPPVSTYFPPPAAPPTGPPPVANPYAPSSAHPQPHNPERPAVIAMAATLAVTGSLQFVGALTLLWLIAVAGDDELGNTGPDGVLYHILNRFDDRMVDGLAWPLYGFPLAALVLGFLLPTRRPWVRTAFSALGLAVVAWLAWLFRSDPTWLIVPAGYIAFTVAILWTAAASRWYAWRPGSDGHLEAR